VTFANDQTGQLDKANADKSAIIYITDECYRQNKLAAEQANYRMKPWYGKIFSHSPRKSSGTSDSSPSSPQSNSQ
jgi:hypothetical protein